MGDTTPTKVRRRHSGVAVAVVGVCVVVVLVACLGLLPTVSASPAPEEPRNGIENETFHALWSKTPNGAYSDADTTPEELRNRSDVSFQQPLDAVEVWNHNEYKRFPLTGDDVSVAPSGTTTQSSPDTAGPHQNGWIKDGYIELFAVSPSTKLHRSPGDTVTYVPQNGTVIAHLDYRYEPPPPPYTSTNGNTRITWYDKDSEIDSVRVNGISKTPTSTIYHEYSGPSHGSYSISVRATFTAEITKMTERKICPANQSCYWKSTNTTYTDELSVTDSTSVEVYDPVITGAHSQLNDSTTDIELGASEPWQGVELPSNETVLTNWRYFAGRDTDWDGLNINTNAGSSPSYTLPSNPPAQPLQTHAFPSSFGSTAETDSFSETQLLNADGPGYNPPLLPGGVDIDPVDSQYNTTAGFAFRASLSPTANLTAYGLVNGYRREIPVAALTEKFYTNTTLNATVTNQTNAQMTVAFELTDNATGAPVDTSGTSGRIEIGGKQVDTNASGQAVATVPNAPMTAEYQPSPYYETFDHYRPSSATVLPEPVIGSFTSVLNDVFTIVFLFGLFFSPLFILDRILDADIWPPWKNVWRELF